MDARRSLLLRFYKGLDTKNVEGMMATLHPDIDIPDQIDGGRRTGMAAVRDYYLGAFALIDGENTPSAFHARPDGTMEVRVHHHVTSLDGALWHDGPVDYSFGFRDGLIVRMDRIGG
ncbi:MAG: ketosteroid isomerase [Caulobacter sp.]|nr:ketosteroid isomerase [Caulobacter sp.]